MTVPSTDTSDPHARHDHNRALRDLPPRQTVADLEREIASLERAITDPDWKLGCHPGMQRKHYRWQLGVMRRALAQAEADVAAGVATFGRAAA